jgi:hypothetical protein
MSEVKDEQYVGVPDDDLAINAWMLSLGFKWIVYSVNLSHGIWTKGDLEFTQKEAAYWYKVAHP